MIKTLIVLIKDNATNDKAPNRRLVAKIGEHWEEVGVGWAKKKEDGSNYISIKMLDAKPYTNKDGEARVSKGFIVVEEKHYNQLLQENSELKRKLMTPEEKLSYGEVLDPNDIPF